MLRYIADETCQEKLNHQIDLLSQLLEPLMMLIIGSLIGIIMMGMYLPIFSMGSGNPMMTLAFFLLGGLAGIFAWLYIDRFIPNLQQEIYQNYVELYTRKQAYFP